MLAETADKTMVISQGATVRCRNPKVIVAEYDTDIGMKAARNILFDYALRNKYDYIIQADDDLWFKPFILEQMLAEIEEYPWIGSISSEARVYANWQKDLISSHDFVLIPNPSQLWIIRMKVIREIGMLVLDVLEDVELGLRMWGKGWAVTRLHLGVQYTHNPVISRLKKGDDQGGQPVSLRNRLIPSSVEFINKYHGAVLRYLRLPPPGSNRSFLVGYNWDEMCKRVRDRWGSVGYKDNSGKEI
jgi:GT2 family glycosyltransferase